MRRLDEIVAEMMSGLRERLISDHDAAPANDDRRKSERFVRIAQELNEAERKRKNRRRHRRAAG